MLSPFPTFSPKTRDNLQQIFFIGGQKIVIYRKSFFESDTVKP